MTALVLTVEHASCAVPPGLDLGLPAEVVSSHIGWDPGALPLAEALASARGAPLHAGAVSRLVVDLNRRESDPGAIPAVAFGVRVPGNEGLAPADRDARLRRWHRPFRAAVACDVAARVASGGCLHLSVHSFDPSLSADRSGLDLGVLFDPARPAEVAVARALLDALVAAGLGARVNAPYAGTAEGHTTALRERHPKGYVGIELELAQGLPPARADAARRALSVALTRALGPLPPTSSSPAGGYGTTAPSRSDP